MPMKQFYPIPIFLFFVFFLIECGPSDNQILATFTGGDVKRSEMRYLIRLDLGEEANNKATIQMQSEKIRQLALLKIAALIFDKNGIPLTNKEKRMQKLRDLEARQLAYTYKLKQNSNDFKITMHEIQFLSLNQSPNAPDRMEEAKSYIKELNKKKSDDNEIEDYIQQKSEHRRYKWLGGYMDPVCIECNMNAGLYGVSFKQMLDKLENVKEKEFIIQKGHTNIIIFRKFKSSSIELKDLEEYLLNYFRKTMKLSSHYAAHTDGEQKAAAAAASMAKSDQQLLASSHELAKHQINKIISQITRVKLEQLRTKHKFEWMLKNPDILLNIHSTAAPDANVVLFTIARKPYYIHSLKKDLKDLGLEHQDQNELYSIINGIIVPMKILEFDDDFINSRDSNDFLFFQKLVRLRIKNQALYSNIEIEQPTNSEILRFYEKRKQSLKNQNAPGLQQLKKQIATYIINQKRSVIIKERQQQMADKYKLKILGKYLLANKL